MADPAARPGVDEHVRRPNRTPPQIFRIGTPKPPDPNEITDRHRRIVEDWVGGVTHSSMRPEQRQEFDEFFNQHAKRTPELWRGFGDPHDPERAQTQEEFEALGPNSWSEDPQIAHRRFGDRIDGSGQIRHMPAGMARGIRVLDYVHENRSSLAQSEKEWIVHPGLIHDRRSVSDVDPDDPNQLHFTPMLGQPPAPTKHDVQSQRDPSYDSSWVKPTPSAENLAKVNSPELNVSFEQFGHLIGNGSSFQPGQEIKPEAPHHNPVTGEPYGDPLMDILDKSAPETGPSESQGTHQDMIDWLTNKGRTAAFATDLPSAHQALMDKSAAIDKMLGKYDESPNPPPKKGPVFKKEED